MLINKSPMSNHQDYKSLKYGAMYYKNCNSIGIYQKKPQRQVFNFGGKRCSSSKQVLKNVASDALKKLDEGMDLQEVQNWAVASIEFDT